MTHGDIYSDVIIRVQVTSQYKLHQDGPWILFIFFGPLSFTKSWKVATLNVCPLQPVEIQAIIEETEEQFNKREIKELLCKKIMISSRCSHYLEYTNLINQHLLIQLKTVMNE